MSAKPLITIVTPYYNAVQFADSYISMLQAQTFTQWIAFLINDYSSDSTTQQLRSYSDGDSRFIFLENTLDKSIKSPASARNLGISRLHTPYTALCDIDDVWHPRKLEIQLAHHLQCHSSISVTTYFTFSSSTGKLLSLRTPPASLSLATLVPTNPIPLSSVILNTSLLINHRFQQVHHEDYLFWISLFKCSPSIRYSCLATPLLFYRKHQYSLTANRFLMPIWTFKIFRFAGFNLYHSVLLILLWAGTHSIRVLRSLIIRTSYSPQTLASALSRNPASITLQTSDI